LSENQNYFNVSCTTPINYHITEDDRPTLEFFLLNLFEKQKFRPGQFPIISNVLSRRDTIGLLPTGGGKSLCYQLPCLLQPSVNFVVCPIKSLMYDQQLNMQKSYITNTNSITSDLEAYEKKKVEINFARGKYLFIWISPERFQKKEFRQYLTDVSANLSISYAIIDEVHCMSEWGHDFRTSYLNLTKTIQRFCSDSTKFIGLTATASVNVLKDIKVEFSRNDRKIGDENIKSLLDYSRKELIFEIVRDGGNKPNELEFVIDEHALLEQKDKATLVFTPHVNGEFGCFYVSNKINLLRQNSSKWYSGEVPKYKTNFFVNRHEANNQQYLGEKIITHLEEQGIDRSLIVEIINKRIFEVKSTRNPDSFLVKIGNGIPVINKEKFKHHKNSVQRDYKDNKFPLLVATKAFGMGIDKQNIHYTIHYGIPSSVESFYQEAGRAGRWSDKSKQAKCYVLYTPETIDQEQIDEIFSPHSSFSDVRDLCNDLGWNEGKDIVKQINLFLNGQIDTMEEFRLARLIIDNYYKESSTQTIWFSRIVEELKNIGFKGSKESLRALAQKGIYRLRLLGIVSDWTNDFVNCFEVEFATLEDSSVYQFLNNYISKYQPDIELFRELNDINQPTMVDKCLWFLLKWTFENIAYNRKQSLKTLADWCNDFEEIGNDKFKERIDNYFRFKWFDVFYAGKDLVNNEEGIHIPEIADELAREIEFERLRDSLSRFLESYKNNTGLNFISGLIRLSLDDFDNPDGKVRFEDALRNIKKYPKAAQKNILRYLIKYGEFLSI